MKYMYQNIKKLLCCKLIPVVLSLLLFPMTAWAAETSVSVSIPVSVKVTGSNIPTGVSYTFVIEAVTPGAPLPTQQTLTFNQAGDLSFDPMTYTTPGDYQYQIRQSTEARNNFTLDNTIYHMTVRINNAADGGLTTEVWAVSGDNEKKADGINFTNQYSRSGNNSNNNSSDDGDSSSGSSGGRTVDGDGLTTISDDQTPLSNLTNLIPDGLTPLAFLPKTGDTTSAALWMIMIVVSGMSFLLLLRHQKRNE